jgi:hypothetical protein
MNGSVWDDFCRKPYRARSARHPAAPYEGATGVDQVDIAAVDSI